MAISAQFTDEEFEYVREICRMRNTQTNTADLVGRLDQLNSAQVIAVQRDIEQWKRIEYGTEKSKGGIKGTDYDTERNRHYIRNKMRERLNYPPLPGIIGEKDLATFSIGLNSWIGGGGEDEFSRNC